MIPLYFIYNNISPLSLLQSVLLCGCFLIFCRLQFLKIYFYYLLLCVGVCFCRWGMFPWMEGRGAGLPGAGVSGGCKLPDVGAGN